MIIGVSGKIGCGKTTFTKHLATCMAMVDRVASIRSFGDPVKLECAAYFNFPVEWCYSEKGKAMYVTVPHQPGSAIGHMLDELAPQTHITVREALQWYGTEYRRKQDPNYLVKACRSAIQPDLALGLDVIIHDVRFPNEFNWIKEIGGKMVRLEPYKGWKPGLYANHSSETSLDNVPADTWDMKFKPALGSLRHHAFIAMCSLEIV